MTDAQIITLTVAILAVFAGTIFNNSRMGDMNTRFGDIHRHIDDKFQLLSEQMRHMEDNIMPIVGDHEERIQKLEGKK